MLEMPFLGYHNISYHLFQFEKWLCNTLILCAPLQAVTNLLNNENVSDIDRLRLVMLYALRYDKESPVQLMQLFNKLASQSPKYKPGVCLFSTLGLGLTF